jgi:dTDP-4-amino-4,6-dideoxygalactose transaminase
MSHPPPIVPADPRASYLAHRGAIDAAVQRVFERGTYILGAEVRAFEAEFAGYLGAGHAVGVGNGTDALFLALKACDIGPGDAVATVAHTAVATVAAIEATGATPVLVDIDPATFNMDPSSLAEAVERVAARRVPGVGRLRAVVPVHLYGCPADLPAILSVARRHDLRVIEDCAQAHGAVLDGRRVGTWGDLATFSFYPTKNLGAFGDGGAVATSDGALADRVRVLREYGWRERYVSSVPGYNSRLDELQAAILRVKLSHLDADNQRRRHLARLYGQLLTGTDLKLPAEPASAVGVYHLYVVEASGRDALREELRARGVGTGIQYPVPVHLQSAYRDRIPLAVPLPHTEAAAGRVLSLPLYPELEEPAVRTVCEHLRALAGGRSGGLR